MQSFSSTFGSLETWLKHNFWLKHLIKESENCIKSSSATAFKYILFWRFLVFWTESISIFVIFLMFWGIIPKMRARVFMGTSWHSRKYYTWWSLFCIDSTGLGFLFRWFTQLFFRLRSLSNVSSVSRATHPSPNPKSFNPLNAVTRLSTSFPPLPLPQAPFPSAIPYPSNFP